MSQKCLCCPSTLFSCFSSKRKKTSDTPNDNSSNVISPTQVHDPEISPSVPPHPASTAEDASSSAIPAVVKQDDPRTHSSGGGSCSNSIVPAALDAIHQDVNAFEGGKLDVEWDHLINHIDDLLKLIKDNTKKSSQPKRAYRNFWPIQSESINKVKDFLSETKDFVENTDAKTMVRGLLQTIGTAHLAATGLLVISNVLERFEDVSKNRDECLRLLKEVFFLAKVVKQIKDRPHLEQSMRDEVEDATVLILDGCIRCYSQMSSSKFSRFFSTTINKEDLATLKQDLDYTYRQLSLGLGIGIYDEKHCKTGSLPRHYPTYAVGIEEAIREVIDILEWGSEQNALAVILHGFGGMGKTTLARAVFSKLEITECKYSKVDLFQDINSSPNILELQKQILKDLMGEKLPEMRNHEDGQEELARALKNVSAFIYIDNVLGVDELQQLLPRDMDKRAKKLRLLITARDKNVRKACSMKTHFYPLGCMSSTDAKEMFDDSGRFLDSNQLNYITDKCGGIPLMLMLVARALRVATDKPQKDCETEVGEVLKELENLKGEDFGANKIEPYFFVYDKLPEECKDPLLDICSFFHGWDWDTVADIVGDSQLKMLESRALVTRDTNGVVSVHDIILALGCHKSEGVRYRFSSANQVKELLDEKEEKDIQAIKGIWLTSHSKNTLDISASRLDLMHTSLRVLAFESLTSVKGKCNKIFEKLIFFKAEITHFPFHVSKLKGGLKYLNYKPNDLKLSEIPSSLRHMEFDGSLHTAHGFQISSTDLQQLKNLRILKLINFYMLINLPENMGDLVTGLRELCLSGSRSVTKLPESISNLQSLRILRLKRLHNLKILPTDLGSLKSLQELHLELCTSLKELPDSIIKLSTLKLLVLRYCVELKCLPPGLGNLTGLVKIDISYCGNLESIPESIRELKLLQPTLNMSFCYKLKEVPRGLCNLRDITNLSLRWCRSLKTLPDGFGELASLRVLDLNRCEKLERLPEDFGQLKCLEELLLEDCHLLRELCNDFHCLSSLQILDLSGCVKLKKLHADFHSMKSLKDLNLGSCHTLGGKWMDHVVKITSLQFVHIEKSQHLLKRWADIQKESHKSWSFVVFASSSGQDLSMSEDQKEKIEERLLSDFNGLLKNGRGEPFCLSALPPDTLVLFVCDVSTDFRSYDFRWHLIEETLDDIKKQLQIIYIGPHFSEFPMKVKERIFEGHMSETAAGEILKKVSLISDTDEGVSANGRRGSFLIHHTKMVGDGKGDKDGWRWKLLTDSEMEDYVIGNCERYIQLKELVKENPQSNVKLLRELFAPKEKADTPPVFQKYQTEQDGTEDSEPFTCGVDKLEGKNVILEMRPAHFCNDIRLSSLEEMYLMEKERLELEIISIPIVEPHRDMDVFDVHTQLSRKVPWLVLQNSWDIITRVVKYFLVKQGEWKEGDEYEKCYKSIIWIIEFNGNIKIYNPSLFHQSDKWKVLFNYLESVACQVKWGTKVMGETAEELRKEEWKQLKSMSTLEFIFNHLGSVSNQVREMMFQGKIICLLYAEDYTKRHVTSSILNSMVEVRDSIHIVYISRRLDSFKLTDTITAYCYNPSEDSVKMDGISLLNLLGDEAVKFSMRLLQWKDEINKNDDYENKQLCELRRLLLPFSLQGGSGIPSGCMIFMHEDGNMFATCGTAILHTLAKDKLKGWMQLLVKVFMEEEKERRHESSFCNLTNSIQTAATAIKEEIVDLDLDLDCLIQYTSDLLEQEELYQLLEFNKGGKKPSRPQARHRWPTSAGFSMLKNFLSEGISANWVEDIISGEPQEDKWKSVTKRLLKEVGEAQWGAAGLLTVAEVLDRFETISTNRNECLFILDKMKRLAIYVMELELKERRGFVWTGMKREATGSIMVGAIMCFFQSNPSKFALFGKKSINKKKMTSFNRELKIKCKIMAESVADGLGSRSGSLLEEMCNYEFKFVTGELAKENESELPCTMVKASPNATHDNRDAPLHIAPSEAGSSS